MVPHIDSSILHEIVRVIEARGKVPERVRLHGGEYQLTYLDDHKQRLEEALRRHDPDRLNMLYGQMASKVKYQFIRQIPERGKPEAPAAKKTAKLPTSGRKTVTAARGRPPAKKAAAKKPSGVAKPKGRRAPISRAART